MRKKLQVLFILLISQFCRSQDNSLVAAVNSPASLQTGLPEVSYSFVNLPATKDMSIDFGLTYNPNAHSLGEYSGIIARNWLLTGSNFVITRSTMGSWPDEIQNDNNWDDIYYYNVNGEQGSFKFEKEGVFPNDTYKIVKLTPSDISIESERILTEYSWEPKHVKSFLIKDSKGYKYYFTDYDFIRYRYFGIGGATPISDLRNTFYVKKIEDPAGREIAVFQNKKYTQYTDSSGDIPESWYFLPEIVTTEYGSIMLEHSDSNEHYYPNEFQFQDSHYINSITLRDKNESFISKYELKISSNSFNQTFDGYKMYRELNEINRVDHNDISLDKIDLSYIIIPHTPYGVSDPINTDLGFLNEIRFSSGKKIEYTFGFSTIKSPIDFNDPSFIASLQNPSVFIHGISFYRKALDLNIDTKITRKYYLPLSSFVHSNTKIQVVFNRSEWYPNGHTENPSIGGEDLPQVFEYRLIDPVTNFGANVYDSNETFVINPNHNVYLEVIGTGGKGNFEIFEKDYLPPPYPDIVSGSLVLKDVKYYELNKNYPPNYGVYDLKKSVNYDYTLFNGSNIDSGEAVYSNNEPGRRIYKNIKVTESDKAGYTKYYFKTSSDFPKFSFPNEPDWIIQPANNYTKRGLIHKIEIYSSDNRLVSLKINDYIFPPNDNAEVVKAENIMPEKIILTEISKDATGNSLTTTSERVFNQLNNNLMNEKRTSADGIISETSYEYAAEKGNSKLLNVGMTSVPLAVNQKQNNIQIGKLETKYEQAGNYFPSSVQSFGVNDVLTGEQVNNHYDTMGNVLQTTSKSGVPTAIIWGYNGTQPIAKIEGGEYFNVLSLLGESNVNNLDIVKKSNQDISSMDNTNEQLLRDALEIFRKKPGFKNYLITTYTYDPLIGVKSVTTPNGFTEYYYYDNQNRLIRIEDDNHHIIKENKYHYNIFNN